MLFILFFRIIFIGIFFHPSFRLGASSAASVVTLLANAVADVAEALLVVVAAARAAALPAARVRPVAAALLAAAVLPAVAARPAAAALLTGMVCSGPLVLLLCPPCLLLAGLAFASAACSPRPLCLALAVGSPGPWPVRPTLQRHCDIYSFWLLSCHFSLLLPFVPVY